MSRLLALGCKQKVFLIRLNSSGYLKNYFCHAEHVKVTIKDLVVRVMRNLVPKEKQQKTGDWFMKTMRFYTYIFWILTLIALGSEFGLQSGMAAENTTPVPIEEEDMEVLASGPIHEAFAEAIALEPESGIDSPKEPPPLIEEMPPNQKPEGNVQWIPGYWIWDDDRNDYIWVSGIWRVPPPGRQWVPGYWNPVGNGYQWVSGYWAAIEEQETEYLPEPPESVEVGPSSYAPSPDYIWIPGCWVWVSGRYAWRPGYWTTAHSNWIWVPAHYNWTPRGYIFVGGYWDHIVIHRGVLFAPVFFRPRVHIGWFFSFSPGFVIDLNIFDDALFLRPRYRHYYFGDYYAPHYYRRGIYPWFSLHARRNVYDPIYAHQRWHHRKDRDWENRLERSFRERRDHEELRPPRSYDRFSKANDVTRSAAQKRPNFVMPLDRIGKNQVGAYRFKPMSETERNNFMKLEKEVGNYRQERQNRETFKQNIPDKPSQKVEPNREKFSRSPILDRSSRNSVEQKALPVRQKEPQPNLNIEPLERQKNTFNPIDKSQNKESRMNSDNGRQKTDFRKQGGNKGK